MSGTRRTPDAAAPALLLIAAAAVTPAAADPVAEFYRGKRIDLVIGYSAGGTYDLYARLVGRHIGSHIPGTPQVVPRNMPGAGSRTAAAWVYGIAPKDGTILATSDQSLAVQQAMGDKGVTVDVTRFAYIGNPSAENNTTATWHTSGVRTIEDAKRREVTMGATGGSTSSQYPKLLNALAGTRFKVILGYPGGNEINIAMERGEVDGRGSNSWASWKSTRPEWVSAGRINILVQIGLAKAPDLPHVPLMLDLATGAEDRAIMRLMSASTAVGRPIFTTPGVPAERVSALRAAFDAMVKDARFLADAKAAKLDIDAVGGVELQRVVSEIVATQRPVAERALQIIGGIH